MLFNLNLIANASPLVASNVIYIGLYALLSEESTVSRHKFFIACPPSAEGFPFLVDSTKQPLPGVSLTDRP